MKSMKESHNFKPNCVVISLWFIMQTHIFSNDVKFKDLHTL